MSETEAEAWILGCVSLIVAACFLDRMTAITAMVCGIAIGAYVVGFVWRLHVVIEGKRSDEEDRRGFRPPKKQGTGERGDQMSIAEMVIWVLGWIVLMAAGQFLHFETIGAAVSCGIVFGALYVIAFMCRVYITIVVQRKRSGDRESRDFWRPKI